MIILIYSLTYNGFQGSGAIWYSWKDQFPLGLYKFELQYEPAPNKTIRIKNEKYSVIVVIVCTVG